jgi:hypothetical protein
LNSTVLGSQITDSLPNLPTPGNALFLGKLTFSLKGLETACVAGILEIYYLV